MARKIQESHNWGKMSELLLKGKNWSKEEDSRVGRTKELSRLLSVHKARGNSGIAANVVESLSLTTKWKIEDASGNAGDCPRPVTLHRGNSQGGGQRTRNTFWLPSKFKKKAIKTMKSQI